MDKVICGDCLEVMRDIDASFVDLIFADPPYNIGKAAWDKIDSYLEWSATWIKEAARVLKPNGAFWVSHSKPPILMELSKMISRKGYGLINWITWDKYNGAPTKKGFRNRMDGFTMIGSMRSFQPMTEYLIYHADESNWTAQCDREHRFIFEPLRAYLAGERDRTGISDSQIDAAWCKWKGVHCTRQTQKWFSSSCFNPPTQEAYNWLRSLFGSGYFLREWEDLRHEYEELWHKYKDRRREYEGLRYSFNNPGKVSSVWQFPPAKPNGHPTPKPIALLERIIKATSNEGDLALDPFGGSGTTGVACINTNRQFILIEKDPNYCEIACKRIDATPERLI